jgi:uncharacterized protein YbjT (DUF2867 family)
MPAHRQKSRVQSQEAHMIVVAGVTGRVGSAVGRALLEQKQKIKAVVHHPEKGKPWSEKGAEIATGSLDDVGFLTRTLKGASAFFALLPPNYHAADFLGSQYKMADAIAEAVRASGVPHVVILSSVGADLPSGTGPIKALHRLEENLRATGAKLCAVRATMFQENVTSAIAPAKEQGIYPSFAASADYPIPMVATTDIGAVAAGQLLHEPQKGEIVDVSGPAYSSRRVAEKLSAALGKTVRVVDIPPAQHVEALIKAGFNPSVAREFAEMYAGFASGNVKPKGDRMVQGRTEIDEVIRGLVAKA